PSLRGDEWHAAHPLQQASRTTASVPQALISSCLMNGSRIRTILVTPLGEVSSRSAFALDGRGDPLPLVVPELREDRMPFDDRTVQFFDLRELEEDLKHGTVLLLDV